MSEIDLPKQNNQFLAQKKNLIPLGLVAVVIIVLSPFNVYSPRPQIYSQDITNSLHQLTEIFIYHAFPQKLSQQNLSKSITAHGQLNGQVLAVDPSIIELISKTPEIKKLVFNILDDDVNGKVTKEEVSKAISQVFKNSSNQTLIAAFEEEAFNKVNNSQPFQYPEFSIFYDSFMAQLLSSSTEPIFKNTPPFEKEEIKGLILFLASGRKNWDRCLVTVFHILDANSDQNLTKSEIQNFFEKINKDAWVQAQPHVDKIWDYMVYAGNANDDGTNLGNFIAFGELVRPYIPEILEKHFK